MLAKIIPIYCDESGFTGENLLHDEQTIFSYASISCDEIEAEEFAKYIIKKYKIQTTELKGTNLLTQKSGKGKEAILEILRHFNGKYKVSIHNKKFALACKFFEYIFEPIIASSSTLFYKNNFHLFIANFLYMLFSANDLNAEQIFEKFEESVRTKQFNKLEALFNELQNNKDDFIISMIIDFIKIHHKIIKEEIENLPKWTLDLTTTSLYTLLANWNKDNDCSLKVFCDSSKPLEYDKKFFDCFIGRKEKIYSPYIKTAVPLTFNLLEKINMVDSKTNYAIQIADVISVAYAYSFKNDNDFSKQVHNIGKEYIIDRNIFPDFNYIDPEKSSAQLNMMILKELHFRSKNKIPLLLNFSDIIREMNINLLLQKFNTN
ncbi:DUF3800 domain-containing protein [Aliarcobacter skirrowii]|uniref:DUF3800 domain-containing protein n=1 Tax=Aliarcobacter skirrowii TaxID=28200 RepID=UPI0029BBADF2|nr:DUF3800 domain-containing protein [Aliarcobacter skirrowii]MDX4028283.1 DUF3800 domain-containing protein [Aliarcobacter skirrowii]